MALSTRWTTILLAATAASCAAPPRTLPRVRFANAPAVWRVDDQRDVPKRPDVSLALDDLDYYDRSFAGPILRALELPAHHRARGVNALDEVPDSTWFTNRIGVRDLSPEQIRQGPVEDEGPETHVPWTILSTKGGGSETGFMIRDARGVKYLIEFDHEALPELETGADIVTDRLLWAFGYNVPADQVAFVRPSDLVLAPDAKIKDHLGHTTGHLDAERLEHALQLAWRAPDGRFRVKASRFLSGTPLGGTPPTGTRGHDPNDRIPHQLRRDQRGQYPLFAWLDHVDLTQSNFLDMWVESPRDPSRHHVVHYKVDFGKSLSVMAVTDHYLRDGYAYTFDWEHLATALFSLGLAPRPWQHRFGMVLTGVSPTFSALSFDPGAWHPDLPYPPFQDADRFDMFWGTKILARFTRAQIHAAVEAARFSDPRTVEYLTDTLVARQRETEAYWYARVNPLDRFRAVGDALCFDDLAIAAQLASPQDTHYELASYDRQGRALGRTVIAAPGAGACTRGAIVSAAADGYTIVKITTLRPEYAGSTFVHVARDPRSGAWHVIGVWRI